LPENADEASEVAVCICTLGTDLDFAVHEAMKAGDGLCAALLDAAGVGDEILHAETDPYECGVCYLKDCPYPMVGLNTM
jgi:hypothetical protein